MEDLEVVDLLTVESVLGDSVGPDAPTVVHANGSKESRCIVALDVVPKALSRVIAHESPVVRSAYERVAKTERRSRERADAQLAVQLAAVGMLSDFLAAGEDDPEAIDLLDAAVRLILISMPIEGSALAVGLLDVGKVLAEGEVKYGGDQNWRGIPVRQHLRHALTHLLAHIAGDRSEGENGHLARAVCRIMFAIEVALANVVLN